MKIYNTSDGPFTDEDIERWAAEYASGEFWEKYSFGPPTSGPIPDPRELDQAYGSTTVPYVDAKDKVAALDELAARRGVTRLALIREATAKLLAEDEESRKAA